jgi:hypothetical protein
MATVPNWIQQDNDQKAEEVRKADEAWKRCLEGGGKFVQDRGMGYLGSAHIRISPHGLPVGFHVRRPRHRN